MHRAILMILLGVTMRGVVSADEPKAAAFRLPSAWEYSAPLISPEARDHDISHAQKDPSIVFHDGQWHAFMTVKLKSRTAIEYCSFTSWDHANESKRTLLAVSDSAYVAAPQVFYFTPHRRWYLIYQVGVPGQKKMMVAYSTTTDIADPNSWSKAQPMLDGGPTDPRTVGGIDYWIICDEHRAYLFFTSNNGKLWRMWTHREDFPRGFDHCQIALEGSFFEASHTYRLKGLNEYLTLIEADGRRHYKAYVADALDGPWKPLADTEQKPFAGPVNIRPAPGVKPWTDNVSHGELIRDGIDEFLTVNPADLRFVFQGMWEADKAGESYGEYPWRIGILTPGK